MLIIKIESVFIDICPNNSKMIIGGIYKYPMLHIGNFNSNYIFPLLQKLPKESSKRYFHWVTLILTYLSMSQYSIVSLIQCLPVFYHLRILTTRISSSSDR